jgi:hypothetical protein
LISASRSWYIGSSLEKGIAVIDRRGLEELKKLGAGRPAPQGIVELYRRAFREFGAQSLWSRRPSAHPTITQALVIAESLRREGNMKSRPLAARIEEACRAAL